VAGIRAQDTSIIDADVIATSFITLITPYIVNILAIAYASIYAFAPLIITIYATPYAFSMPFHCIFMLRPPPLRRHYAVVSYIDAITICRFADYADTPPRYAAAYAILVDDTILFR